MTRAALAAVLSCAAFAQPQSPRTFDIASVQVSPRSTWAKTPVNSLQGGYLVGDRYELHRATMVDLIHTAYGVDADKIYGGPNWLDYDKFDVSAKTAPGTRPEALRQMLQALLADRFKLAVKPDTQPVPAYVLRVKDQSKLKPSESAGGEGCQNIPFAGPGGGPPMNTIRCRGVTMDEFASALRRIAGAYFENLPAVNSTALEGAWDIDLKYPPRGFRIDPSGAVTAIDPNGLPDALDKLGLKLELGKAPQPVLTVESVNEQPAPDPPGANAALPALPAPQFEVASLRPCDADVLRLEPLRLEPGGRVTGCMPLSALFYQAFNTNAQQQPVGLPKSLQDNGLNARINIVAKAPAGVFPNYAVDAAETRETLNEMIRALLVDRYKITFHYEDRPVDADTLVATKPKMTKADPSERTGCNRQGNDPGTPVKLICKNITMAQFAEQLLALYPAARYPVADGTHLEGAWDFTIEFNPIAGLSQQLAQLRARAAAEAGTPQAAADAASEPASGPANVAEAMEKQIGLKLESHKRPEKVLVIDHMEEKPTDN